VSDAELLELVDRRAFRRLFIDELGWNNPDHADMHFDVEGIEYNLTQIAGYKGLRIWFCPELPARKVQRVLDELIGQNSHERLIIFADDIHQEWRWPRKAQMGAANAKLLVHRYTAGLPDQHMANRLNAIAIDFDEDLSLIELLKRVRIAFDAEAEVASVQAARLMGVLYNELESAGTTEHEATLLLARLLFLLFGDDSGMWTPDMFGNFVTTQTDDANLAAQLSELFKVLDTDERKRTLDTESPLVSFRYINGGLFADESTIEKLTSNFRDALISACEFDWGIISPAVFGSMFQTVKNKEDRRRGGEHYTSERDILKTIGPLFLDEYRSRLEESWTDKKKLLKLHKDLGDLRFLDPACGCGNFLIVTYRELRALELDLLKQLREVDIAAGVQSIASRGQLSFDVTGDIKVTLDHFYGIELEEWPARIAETAMLLVDHLANQRMQQDFGLAPDRLPIMIAPTIVHHNALTMSWQDVLPSSDNTFVFGNPPFLGKEQRSAEQTAQMAAVWGSQYSGEMDFVTSWFIVAAEYLQGTKGRFAFVATSSISQGVVVAPLFRPLLALGWRIRFAHRSFIWTTEATGAAGVHCVIVGFDKEGSAPRLFEYESARGVPFEVREVESINGYLVASEALFIDERSQPLNSSIASNIRFGSMAADGGGFFLTAEDAEAALKNTSVAPYIRKFVGARELIHGTDRWCIWMPDRDESAIAGSALLSKHIEAVHTFRSEAKDANVRKDAASSHRFHRVKQPTTNYLCIPRHFSENRDFATVAYLDNSTIAGDANFTSPDPDGFLFAVISSRMFMTWQKAVGGRLRADLRFSSRLTWNSYPLPEISVEVRAALCDAAAGILSARAAHSGRSLAFLYSPLTMPSGLVEAHAILDSITDALFGLNPESSLIDRQKRLFDLYVRISESSQLSIPTNVKPQRVASVRR